MYTWKYIGRKSNRLELQEKVGLNIQNFSIFYSPLLQQGGVPAVDFLARPACPICTAYTACVVGAACAARVACAACVTCSDSHL